MMSNPLGKNTIFPSGDLPAKEIKKRTLSGEQNPAWKKKNAYDIQRHVMLLNVNLPHVNDAVPGNQMSRYR